MINILFRLLLTLNATSLLVIIYLVKTGYTLDHFFCVPPFLADLPHAVSYATYFAIPVLFTGLSIILSSKLGSDQFKEGGITSIEHANNSFLPSYLGYFFVALSIPNEETLVFVYSILFVFTFSSQALYFNPLFLLYGYKFYNIRTSSGTAIFLISKHSYKVPLEVAIPKASRINDYTFIERA